MARKNDNDATIGCLLFIVFMLIVGTFFIVKWAILATIIIVSAVTVGIINLARKQKRKNYIKSIVEKNFENAKLRPTFKITPKELKEKLELFDISKYEKSFEPQIRFRGQKYYAENRVENVNRIGELWKCEVIGTERYNVSIKFENDEIVESNCNCPYYEKDNQNCKHIYALLIKAKCEGNLSKILEAITDYSKRMTNLVKEETEYIKNNQKSLKLDSSEFATINSEMNDFVIKLTNASKTMEKNKYNESVLIDILISLIESSYKYNQKIEEMLIKAGKVENPASIDKVINSVGNSGIGMGDIFLGAMATNSASKHIQKKKTKNLNKELEDEMDEYCLEDWQKDLVRKGEYNPWNFEEEDLEEGDYFYEDPDINPKYYQDDD